MLLAELQKLAEAKELISIERDCHDSELTGFIRHLSDSLVTMQLFENNGRYDGFAAFEFDQIEEVYWGNREHKAIAHLIAQNEIPEFPTLESSSFEEAVIELNGIFSSLCFHERHDEDSFDIGALESHDEDWYKFRTYSPRRTLSRMNKIVRTNTISRVVVDSPYQNEIVLLHSCNL